MLEKRFIFSARLASRHFLVCLVVAALVAFLVFTLWYPSPYYRIAGGLELFALVVAVDVVCGPLLTFVLCNPSKPRGELRRDIALVAVIQLVALGYGVNSLYEARPVYLAFEGDRFRLVSAADIDQDTLTQARPEYRELPIVGPELIATKLLGSSDPGYLDSLQDALQGFHPSYKPERWESYSTHVEEVKSKAKPLAELLVDNRGSLELSVFARSNANLGYFPLDSYQGGDWIVVLDLEQGTLADILPVDGW